jgi:hypothetical protein
VSAPVSDLAALLATLEPALHPGVFVFAVASEPPGVGPTGLDPIATFREGEGTTVVVTEEEAERFGLKVFFRAAWITLTVHSDLAAVGLTAAVAATLAAAGIGCNVIAAVHHDHLFVPCDEGARAVALLRELQARSATRS